jgi:hypothetical protein
MVISFVVTYVVGSIVADITKINFMIIVNKFELIILSVVEMTFIVKFGNLIMVNTTGLQVSLFSFSSIEVIF